MTDRLRLPDLGRWWGPVFLWMAAIFYFSSRRNPLGFLPSTGRRESIDKVAHFAEYAGLTALLYRALSNENTKPTSQPSNPQTNHPPAPSSSFGASFLIAFAYAISDELHQELTPGRRFELADVGYDLAGMVTALSFIWMHRHPKPRRNPVEKTSLSRDEQFMLALHDLVLSAFREHFGEEAIIGVSLTPLAHECWITVQVRQRTQPMVDLAHELETELVEDAGRHVAIFVEQPWRVTAAQLVRRIIPSDLRGFRTDG